MKLTAVRMYVDHSRIGSGVRGFLVLKRGTKWARLLYGPTLTGISVPIKALDNAREVPLPKGLKKYLSFTAQERERMGLPWSKKDTETALKMKTT